MALPPDSRPVAGPPAQVIFTTLGLVFFIELSGIIAQMLQNDLHVPVDLEAEELAKARADAKRAREDVAIYHEALKKVRVQLAEAQAAEVAGTVTCWVARHHRAGEGPAPAECHAVEPLQMK